MGKMDHDLRGKFNLETLTLHRTGNKWRPISLKICRSALLT